MKPVASVVTIADYEAGTPRAWDDLRRTLAGLASQDFDEPVEFIFLENIRHKEQIPNDLSDVLPSLKVVLSSAELQYALKSEAACVAQADIVILLDADCVPARDWLRHIVNAMRSQDRPAVVSGRTLYEGRDLLERCCALLGRAYVDRRHFAPTRHISNNNAAFGRSALLAHPLPLNGGPFASRLHAEAIIRDGGRLFFEPRARVVHAFDGWDMERDIRHHKGYATIAIRRLDPQMPFARVGRLGLLSAPLLFTGRLLESWWKGILFYHDYGIRWYELPVLFWYAVAVHLLEVPGMMRGIRRRPIAKSAYR